MLTSASTEPARPESGWGMPSRNGGIPGSSRTSDQTPVEPDVRTCVALVHLLWPADSTRITILDHHPRERGENDDRALILDAVGPTIPASVGRTAGRGLCGDNLQRLMRDDPGSGTTFAL